MNTKQITETAAIQIWEKTMGMKIIEIEMVMRTVVNLTLQAVVENIKDDENPIMLREKIRNMEVK